MKAIQFDQFGPPKVLKLVDTPTPEYRKNQMLIKVHAASLNPIDYKTRNGSGFVAKKLKNNLPSGLGYDFSGEVIELGSDVNNVNIGDKVMGIAGFPDHPCCYAEYVCASPDTIIQKLEKLSFLQAASLPTAGLTALQALNQAEVKQGDVVLIHAGAGGVGHLAIQLAKQKDTTVITTASKRNHAFLKALGAEQCINYHEEDFLLAISTPVDAVIDLVGGDVGIQSIDCLKETGCIVSVPTITAGRVIEVAKQKHRRAFGLLKQFNIEELHYLGKLVSEDKLRIEISRIFQLSEAVTAHELLETGHVRGKLVFKVR
ncbi:quinone oxidoreductase [Coxiella burnetii]|uniref:Quinone oxidoreductase n=1 Tax=Coxiella burnetii (strain Dugway 5J108-111) TaxID=434922 RepID=A9KG54_COXBN|nr:NADP-dependent oxidoreductase [Coxiella burnetii]ABS78015.1 quinone oxidoreductase [Coxiella burnetii Dugway 5J108-111]OYK80177.1 quinone oxidoreductase [Coxiella burnetii]OYK82260.1 quinone oxidoreductase [Coxiella burnetii]